MSLHIEVLCTKVFNTYISLNVNVYLWEDVIPLLFMFIPIVRLMGYVPTGKGGQNPFLILSGRSEGWH